MRTQDYLSNEAQVSSTLYDNQRLELYKYFNQHKKLFTKLEFGKTVIIITFLTRDKYKATKKGIESEIEKRKAEGVDHSATYKT